MAGGASGGLNIRGGGVNIGGAFRGVAVCHHCYLRPLDKSFLIICLVVKNSPSVAHIFHQKDR